MSKKAVTALVGWKPVSNRIITAPYHINLAKITIIQTYAPIEDADDTAKDIFYNHFHKTLDGIPHHDIVLLI